MGRGVVPLRTCTRRKASVFRSRDCSWAMCADACGSFTQPKVEGSFPFAEMLCRSLLPHILMHVHLMHWAWMHRSSDGAGATLISLSLFQSGVLQRASVSNYPFVLAFRHPTRESIGAPAVALRHADGDVSAALDGAVRASWHVNGAVWWSVPRCTSRIRIQGAVPVLSACVPLVRTLHGCVFELTDFFQIWPC